ncbi:MAG: hypothetical protein ACRCYO_03980 [Bacteroidia bacterium]
MTKHIFFFAFLFSLIHLSCKVPLEMGDQGKCDLHQLPLRKAYLKGHFGKLAKKIDPKTCPYPKTSPDQGSVKPPWPLNRLVTIYWCSRCDSIYRH